MEGRVQQSLERGPKRNNRKQHEQAKSGMPPLNRWQGNGRGLIRNVCRRSLIFETDTLLGGTRIGFEIHFASGSFSSAEHEDF